MTKKIRVLLVGGTSFLGKNILKQLEKNASLEVRSTTRKSGDKNSNIFLDLAQDNDYLKLLKAEFFDIILWVVGIKDVKWCETNRVLAKKINFDSLVECYEQFESLPVSERPKFIFISSDYVFDGKAAPYTTASEKNPKTYYGQLKSLAEDFLAQKNGRDVAVRTSALCGPDGVFFNWLLSELRQNKSLSLFSNSFLTPTSVDYFSRVIEDLIFDLEAGKASNKILHICGDRRYSRLELALELKKSFPAELIAQVVGEQAVDHLSQDLSLVSSYNGSQGPHRYRDLVHEVKECIKL